MLVRAEGGKFIIELAEQHIAKYGDAEDGDFALERIASMGLRWKNHLLDAPDSQFQLQHLGQ
eukprot:COSAG01_NODE_3602_length_5887_cov_20.077229_1_plen_62_part_00